MGRHPSVLVTGAAGQVGRALRAVLPHATFAGRSELDVTDERAVIRAVSGHEWVVHLAAVTDVNGCERDPHTARMVNAVATANVVAAAASSRARMVYLSTDYVFDGGKDGPYVEGDEPNPLNVYGRTKLEGERTSRALEGTLVLRVSWVYGDGKNFIRTIVAAATATAAAAGGPLRVVDDQRGRPTWAGDIAAAISFAVRNELEGLFHLTGGGEPCSWADLAEHALAAAGLSVPVTRIDSRSYSLEAPAPIARRPLNSVLSLAAARHAGLPVADWPASVDRYVRTLR